MAIGSTASLGMGIIFNLKDNTQKSAKGITKSFMGMSDAAMRASKQIKASFADIGAGFLEAGATSAAVLAPFAIATKKSMDFRAAMSQVQAKANATGKELGELSEMALMLSSAQGTAQFTAMEVAEGMKFLGQAGLDTKQIMDAIRPSLMLASSDGVVGLGEAADIATNTMSQFGLAATDIARIADVLSLSANSSNQNVRQFADGMKFLGSTARAFNVDLEEASAFMMLMANAGLQGSLGTRALGTALAGRLTKPTKMAAAEMKKIGLKAFDANENFVGMIELTRRLEKSLVNLTQKQRLAAITTIFGAESIQEVNSLLAASVDIMKDGEKITLKGADAFAHFTKKNREAGGTAARIAGQQLNNLKGDFTVLMSSIDTALIRIGDALTPVLRPLVQTLSSIVSGITAFLSTKIGKGLTMIAAGFAAVVSGVVMLNFALNVLRPALLNIGRAALTAMAPMAPFIIAVAAIGAAIVLVNKGIDEFRLFMDTGQKSTSRFGLFLQRLGGMVLGIVEIFRTWNGETFQLSQKMRNSLQKLGILETFKKVSTVIVRVIEFSKAFFSTWLKNIRAVMEIFKPAFEAIMRGLEMIIPNFEKAATSVDTWRRAGEFLANALGASMQFVAKVISGLILVVANLDVIWDTVKDGIGKGFDFIKNKAIAFWDFMKSLPARFVAWGKSIGNSIKNGIMTALKGLRVQLALFISDLLGADLGGQVIGALGILPNAETRGDVGGIDFSRGNFNVAPALAGGGGAGTNTLRETRETTEKLVRLEVPFEVNGREFLRLIKEEESLDNGRQ